MSKTKYTTTIIIETDEEPTFPMGKIATETALVNALGVWPGKVFYTKVEKRKGR